MGMKRISYILIALIMLVCMPSCGQQDAQHTIAQPESVRPSVPWANNGDGTADGSGNTVNPTVDAPVSVTPEPESSPIPVWRVTVELDRDIYSRGDIIEPNIVFAPAGATDRAYTLQSSDETVVCLIDGNWTAAGVGEATLTATASNGASGSARVTVIVPAISLSLGEEEINMNRGQSLTLTLVVYPEDTTELGRSFSSSNAGVATVSADGTIYAVAAGTADIRCSIGAVSATVRVNVSVHVASVVVETDRQLYLIGDQGFFIIQIEPGDATDKTYTINVRGEGIRLTGDNSYICVAGGEVTISAVAANGLTGSKTITVIDPVAYANEVLRLTNIERANAGLSPLGQKRALTQVADARARESIQRFSHDRPDGSSCFTALEEYNVDYIWAGENLAMGQRTPAEVVQDWMGSQGHRDNILTGEFNYMGVGVAMDPNGMLYWTQFFTD